MPHIHVSGPDFRATVSIVSGEVIAGKMPASVLREVRSWLELNGELALKLWKERNPSN